MQLYFALSDSANACPTPRACPRLDRTQPPRPIRTRDCPRTSAPGVAPDPHLRATVSMVTLGRLAAETAPTNNAAARCSSSEDGAKTMTDPVSGGSTATQPAAEPDSTDRQSRPQVGSVLRRARTHRQLSLREVERRIGRSNAYLSQVERGLIKQPDPIVLLDLADLYGLNFQTLAAWANWGPADPDTSDTRPRDSTAVLIRQAMELDANERAAVLRHIDSILRKRRT